jgi:group I intron endonuclease
MDKNCGIIYIVINLQNGKQYIGQTSRNLKQRIYEHETYKYCPLIDSAIKKYGTENFKWIFFSCPEKDLDWTESFLIKELNTITPNGYNLDSGGQKNKHHHEITKQQISKTKKIFYKNLEERIKQSKRKKYYDKTHPIEVESRGEKQKIFWKNHPEKLKQRNEKNQIFWQTHPEKAKQRAISSYASRRKNLENV